MPKFLRDTSYLCVLLVPLPIGVWLGWYFADQPPTVLILIMTIGIYPLLEEYVFRGLLQPWLGNYVRWKAKGISVANLIASLLFCAAHLVYNSWAWALGVLLPSMLFGWSMDKFGSVKAPMLLHIAFNSAFMLGVSLAS